MAYVSLYRKYRPQTFEDVVGQEHVTTTLRNAIQEGRVASGYLFCGTRGTAKTTCARILAKALNCIGPDGKRTAPTPEPCGVCGPCQAIAASAFVDVLEMDAASHGKVDDVRDLVASIKFPPMEGRYKVYIIDEAHQLSRDAMDAFLKTLEEPPDRVVFVLATTEVEKLPITIASRCQVFEFKRGSVAQIASRLSEVLKTEKVKAQAQAVTLIARAADGSYRDSLSLLEQVLAYKRDQITPKDVTLVLGTVDEDLLNTVVALVADSDAAGAFALAGSVMESGKDVRQFLKGLAGRFRDMLFVGVGAQPVSAGEMDDSPTLRAQAARFSPAALLQALEVLTEAERETKTNNQHRLLLEMALLRLMRLPQAAIAPTLPVVAPPMPAPVVAAVAPPQPFAEPAPDPALPLAEEEDENDPAGTGDLTDEDDLPTTADVLLPGDDDLDILSDHDDPDEPPSLLITSSEENDQVEDWLHVQQVTAPIAPPVSDGKTPSRSVPTPDAAPEVVQLQRSWAEVINRMSSKPSTLTLIRDAHPVALIGKTFTLEFTQRVWVDKLESNERGRQLVEDAVNRTLGVEAGTYKVKGVLKGDNAPAANGNRSGTAKREQASLGAPEHHSPLVDQVIAVFGGRILDEG